MGALTFSSAHSRFLLLAGLPGDQPLDLSPNTDTVHLAISYSKWGGGQQQVLAVVPGESPTQSALFMPMTMFEHSTQCPHETSHRVHLWSPWSHTNLDPASQDPVRVILAIRKCFICVRKHGCPQLTLRT